MLRIVFVLGVLVVSPSFAVDIREFVDIKTPAVETIGNWIISEFASENLETGFDRIRKANIGINESDLLRIQNTFSSTNLNIVRAYGSVTGIDLISELGISDGYVRLDYLVRHERNSLHVILLFYNTPGGWRLVGFNFDDKINELFPLRSGSLVKKVVKSSEIVAPSF